MLTWVPCHETVAQYGFNSPEQSVLRFFRLPGEIKVPLLKQANVLSYHLMLAHFLDLSFFCVLHTNYCLQRYIRFPSFK